MEFAPAIVEKLRERAKRFDELTELLSTSEVASSGKRSAELLRERGQLEASRELCVRLEELIAVQRRIVGEILRENEVLALYE